MPNKPENRAEHCVTSSLSTVESLAMGYAEVIRLRKEILKVEIASQSARVRGTRSKKLLQSIEPEKSRP